MNSELGSNLITFSVKIYTATFFTQSVPSKPYASVTMSEKRFITPIGNINNKAVDFNFELQSASKLNSLHLHNEQLFNFKISLHNSNKKDMSLHRPSNIYDKPIIMDASYLPSFLPDDLIGENTFNYPSSNHFILQWLPLKSKGGEQTIGQILIAIFPLFVQYVPEIQVEVEKKSWFGMSIKKKISNEEALLQKISASLFADNSTADGIEFINKNLMSVLELCKTDFGRSSLIKSFSPTKFPQEIPFAAKQVLIDIFRVALRSANNQKEYVTCKQILDISLQYYFTTPNETGHRFLYSLIKDHEVFKNQMFWELSFVDSYPSERRRIMYSNDIRDSAVIWNQMDDKAREMQDKREIELSVHICRIYLSHMFLCGNSNTSITEFLIKICKMQNVPSSQQALLDNFYSDLYSVNCFVCYDDIHFRGSVNPEDINNNLKKSYKVEEFENKEVKSNKNNLLNQLMRTASASLSLIPSQLHSEIGHHSSESFDNTLSDDSICQSLNASTQASPASSPRTIVKGSWAKHVTSGGSFFYVNKNTGIVTFEIPEDWKEDEKYVEKLPVFSNLFESIGSQGRSNSQLAMPIMRITKQDPSCVFGEYICKKLDTCFHFSIPANPKGDLFLTNFRLIFVPDIPLNNKYFNLLEVPVHSLQSCDIETINEDLFLNIYSKDFRFVRFSVNKKLKTLILNFVEVLNKYSFPPSIDKFFSFFYREACLSSQNGFFLYDPFTEFQRQSALNKKWVISKINSNFEYSPTYPSHLCLPAFLNVDDLHKIKQFRSKGRIPSLTYFHPNGAIMLRSAQPLSGVLARRCESDEQFLKFCNVRYVLDSRPKANAVGNQALGGGYEDMNCYENCELIFMNIPNIHVVRESLNKLISVCSSATFPYYGADDWWALISASNWYDYCRTILIASVTAARLIHVDAKSILIHCSDGWDRTSQMCALSQLMLDPFYRTLKGFQILIEKDWVSFGHKFSQRIGHGEKHLSDERSPIFIQFLDCVYQTMNQHTVAFEYNVHLLSFIADSLFSCKFGTFLFDNDHERELYQVKTKTVSLWSHINSAPVMHQFINPFYQKTLHPLVVNCDFRTLTVWPYYYRTDSSFNRKSFQDHASEFIHLEREINTFKQKNKLSSTLKTRDSLNGAVRFVGGTRLRRQPSKNKLTKSSTSQETANPREVLSVKSTTNPREHPNETINPRETFSPKNDEDYDKFDDYKKHIDVESNKAKVRNTSDSVTTTNNIMVVDNSTVPPTYLINGMSMVLTTTMQEREAQWQAAYSHLEKEKNLALQRVNELKASLSNYQK